MRLALEGIKVLDVAQVAAVPMAARHLADFGADVIHIEHPTRGDSWRVHQAGQGTGTYGAPSSVNYNWENYNRNKRSLTLDLSQEGGREILYQLVRKTDVFLTNLRAHELIKFQVEYETLSHLNPSLIYGSLTGYGDKGPDSHSPGYDWTALWSRSGIAHRLRNMGMPPAAIGDNVAALAMAWGITMALLVREKTGVGQRVDLSLFHTGVYQLSYDIAGALATGKDCDEWMARSREENPNPLTAIYQTKDNRALLLAILQPDRYWTKLCDAIGRKDIEHDPRFESLQARAKNRVAMTHLLDKVFSSRPLAEWKSQLSEAGIPWSPLQTLTEVVKDPQARANEFYLPFNHPVYGQIEVIANPVKLSKTPASIRMAAPEFGQHTEEILLENGYSWDDIVLLKQKGIIA